MNKLDRIVVTGLGVCTPCGSTIAEFANTLRLGRTGIKNHEGWIENSSVWAGIVSDFNPHDYFDEQELNFLDRTAQMGFVAARQSVMDAGINLIADGDRTALTLGTSHGGRSQFDQFVLSGSNPDMEDAPRRILSTAAHFQQTAAVAGKLGIHGPTATLSNACSSSGAAIAYAIELLRSNKCKFAIAGGADGFSRLTYAGFSALGAMADGPCAPFSEPVGLSLGDGAAFIVLETFASAEARNAKVYAEIWGYGLSWDAYHITAPEPSGEGMNRAIHMAIQHSGIDKSEIEYVNVHGTGTRSNDLAETVGLNRYFEGNPPPVSASKSQTGHMLGASSSVGLIGCILGMNEQWLPPTSNFTTARSGCEIDVIPNESRPQQWSCFMAQSAAFAGANAVIVGGKPRTSRSPKTIEEDEIVISGIGIVSPLGFGFSEFSQAVQQQRTGLSAINEFDVSDRQCQIAGMVRDFQPRKLMPSINLRRVDRVAAFATIAASMAIQHAGRWPLQHRAETTGLVVGVCRGAASSYEKYLASVAECQWHKASAVHFPNLVMSSVGGQVSASLGIKGITSSLVGSTAAGLQALVHGWELFRRNPSQEAVVVLAADELAPFYFQLFDRAGKLAKVTADQPMNHSFKPYSQLSTGMILGEGSAALVLERASTVRQRGGKILATLKGSGLTNDGVMIPPQAPKSCWLQRSMVAAMDHAKIESKDIHAHYGSGCGIYHFDEKELLANRNCLSANAPPQSINSLTGVAEATSSLYQVSAAISGQLGNRAGGYNTMVTACGEDGVNVAVVLESGN